MIKPRSNTGLSGILAVNKPVGISSHSVVNAIRRISGEKRVGHAGTLDPLASGLLLVCVGPATRLADYLMVGTKTYETRICFGTATTTDDAEGEVLRTCAVPTQLSDASFAQSCLAALPSLLLQTPPTYSAIKKNGVVAYKAARAGAALELEPRTVHLYAARLLGLSALAGAAGAAPTDAGVGGADARDADAGERAALAAQTRANPAVSWTVELLVSKGFYVRSFARDLGKQLGTAAHVGALCRTKAGSVALAQATPLDTLEAWEPEVPLPFLNPIQALGLPELAVDEQQARDIANGRPLNLAAEILTAANLDAARLATVSRASNSLDAASLNREAPATLLALTHRGRLLALYTLAGTSGFAKPQVVIPGGV